MKVFYKSINNYIKNVRIKNKNIYINYMIEINMKIDYKSRNIIYQ